MRKSVRVLLLAWIFCALSLPVARAESLKQREEHLVPSLSFLPSLEYPKSERSVATRISLIYGRHKDVLGLDLGLVGNTSNRLFMGFAVSGIFNANGGTAVVLGGQIAGITNVNSGNTYVFGLQLAGGVNVNEGQGIVVGAQVAAFANISPQLKILGVQAGIYNRADSVFGFQIGLVNVANSLHGIQVGLLNINRAGPIEYFPVVNMGI
jgi:hypothetical protein